MKILLVSPFLPYPGVPHAGGKLLLHLLETLAGKHSVFLVSRLFPGEEVHLAFLGKIVSGIETVPAEGAIRSGSLVSLARTVLSYRRLAGKAREVMERERFDLLQVENTETGIFLSPPKGVPSVLSLIDVIAKPAYRRYEGSRGFSRLLRWAKWKALLALEDRAISRYRMVFTLSEVDREWAYRLYPGVQARVLRYPAGLEFRDLPREEVPGRILFVGALHRPQNVEAVRYILTRIWPFVRERHPDAEFWVVGGGMSDGLKAEMAGDPRIRVTGWVASLEEYYRSAAVFVAPILAGGGIIVKIQDAMAAGVPVVTTPYGSEGIGARDKEDLFVCYSPDDFAARISELLGDEDLRRRMGERGREFVTRNFASDSTMKSLESAFDDINVHPFP